MSTILRAMSPAVMVVAVALAVRVVVAVEFSTLVGAPMITTAPPVITSRDEHGFGVQQAVTCDDGHGVFTCAKGECHFDDTGNFACCENTEDCTAITSCAGGPMSGQGMGYQCSQSDNGCTSCEGDRDEHCLWITNPAMSQQMVKCTDKQLYRVISTTEFVFGSMTRQPSTALGPPGFISSDSTTKRTGAVTLPTPTVRPTTSTNIDTPSSIPEDGVIPQKKKTSKGKVGGIVTGVIAGVCAIGFALFMLFKWNRRRQRHQKEIEDDGGGGTLPGPRRSSDDNKSPSNAGIQLDGGKPGVEGPMNVDRPMTTTYLPITHNSVRPKSELYGATRSSPPRPTSMPASSHHAQAPPRISVDPASQKPTNSPSSVDSHVAEFDFAELPPNPPFRASETPSVSSSIAAGFYQQSAPLHSTKYQDPLPSPPFTSTPTPVSPIFSVSSLITGADLERPTGASKVSNAGSGTSPVRNEAEENKYKSSKLSYVAGPYLTADKALGEGYWEAEREQLEADKAMKGGNDTSSLLSKSDAEAAGMEKKDATETA